MLLLEINQLVCFFFLNNFFTNQICRKLYILQFEQYLVHLYNIYKARLIFSPNESHSNESTLSTFNQIIDILYFKPSLTCCLLHTAVQLGCKCEISLEICSCWTKQVTIQESALTRHIRESALRIGSLLKRKRLVYGSRF